MNWCILYNGTEEDGIHLAEMIADACANMSSSSYKQMIASGKYATTMVRLLHSAMKPGTDGPVIKIEDVDQAKLRRLAADV